MSNQTKHTKGPWTAEEGRSIAAVWDTGEHVQVACMSGSRWSTDPRHDDVELNRSRNERMQNEQEANARLIASAPELLEACKAGLESYISLWESEFQTSADHKCTDLVVAKMKAAIAKAEGRTP